MTILVGVKCTDGIVIGADSMTTSAMGTSPLVQVPEADKLQPLGADAILACTGQIGLSQRVKLVADELYRGRQFKGSAIVSAAVLTGLVLDDFNASHVPRHPQHGLNFGALLGIVIEGEPHLIEFATTDFQPELKEGKSFYVSMGSGQLLADPFLTFVKRVLWRDTMPTVERAKIGVIWALKYTIGLAAGGVGGAMRLGVIRSQPDGGWQANVLDDVQEQEQYINELESRISLDEPFKEAESSIPPALDL